MLDWQGAQRGHCAQTDAAFWGEGVSMPVLMQQSEQKKNSHSTNKIFEARPPKALQQKEKKKNGTKQKIHSFPAHSTREARRKVDILFTGTAGKLHLAAFGRTIVAATASPARTCKHLQGDTQTQRQKEEGRMGGG